MLYLLYAVFTAVSVTSAGSEPCQDIEHEPVAVFADCYSYSTTGELSSTCYTNDSNETLPQNILLFDILQELPHDSNYTNMSFCVSLNKLQKNVLPIYTTVSVLTSMEFRRQQVGVVHMTRQCWEANITSCRSEVKLLLEVAELSIFKYNVYEEHFWNFSSPLYSDARGWFLSLVLNEGADIIKPAWVSRLNGTSLQSLYIGNARWWRSTFWLKDLRALETLYLPENALRELSPDCFSGMPNLRSVFLSDNSLKGVPACIQNAASLEYLDISNNLGKYITHFNIDMAALSKLRNLTILILSQTMIQSITEEFPYLPQLTTLQLDGCNLTSLGSDIFKNLPSLQKLDFSNNLLTHIQPNTFLPLLKLRMLDLSKNRLFEWPTFQSQSINTLNISVNNLQTIANFGSTNCSVRVLDVSNNYIFKWSDEKLFLHNGSSDQWLHYFSKSRYYPALFNVNVTSHDRFYPQTSWVEFLILSGNRIASVTRAMGRSLDAVLVSDLGGNPFNCADCAMPEFQHWLNTTPSTVVNRLGYTPLQCTRPANLRDVYVKSVDFDEEACLEKKQSLWLSLGAPLGAVALALTITVGVAFRYRFEITYMVHLYRINRGRKDTAGYDNGCRYDAFVCYSGHNRAWVLQHLVPFLEGGAERYRLCLHDRDFLMGSRIVENIVSSIEQSRKTIIVLSPHFIDSTWCQWELEMANHKMFTDDQNFLLLIQLEPMDRSKLPRHLRFLMDTRTYLEWPKDRSDERAVAQVCRKVRTALGHSIFQMTSENAPLLAGEMDI